jgi:hypothetical protein
MTFLTSVAESRHFDAAPVLGEKCYSSPASTLLFATSTFSKQAEVFSQVFFTLYFSLYKI